MVYNWQQKDWPNFKYDLTEVEEKLYAFAEKMGYIRGILDALPEDAQTQTIIDMMVSEAIKTSEIEGEYLSRVDVMSSIRNNLGLNKTLEPIKDKRANGVAQLMISVRDTYVDKLTESTLHSWHGMLMEGSRGVKVCEWRSHEEPMQVVSGAMGKEKVHFEAPPSNIVPKEMKHFIQWFNDTEPGGRFEIQKAPIRSAIAHVYFETIHPYEDGNGRIGRAISEKALSQGVGMPILLSLSKTIEAKKNDYYNALMKAQRSNEITSWINYFVTTILDAQSQAEAQINFTLKKTKFFDRYKALLNERQEKVIQRMLKEGPDGFEGGMSAKKYISIVKTSKATATRDLQNLVELGVLIPFGGGRSTRYNLNL